MTKPGMPAIFTQCSSLILVSAISDEPSVASSISSPRFMLDAKVDFIRW